MNNKIGVYICHCGGNISDYVDVNKVRDIIEKEEGVALAKTTIFACADSSQKEMAGDIIEKKFDGVVVASCSPKLHLTTFQAVSERAGLNKYNYVHANIREQASWPHSDDKLGATEKAIQIIKAAIAKVRKAKALNPFEVNTTNAVAVVGAGVAGLKAAINLAEKNVKVFIIEKDYFIGGRAAQWDKLFESKEKGAQLIFRLYREVKENSNITLFTSAEIVENSGSIGNFSLKVKIKPRYINGAIEPKLLDEAKKACPVEVPDEFNLGLTNRKAIYFPHAGQYPEMPVIDIVNCNKCGACKKIIPDINLENNEEIITIHAGTVLTATGFDTYKTKKEEFGFGLAENIITLSEFNRLLSLCDNQLLWKNKTVKQIAYIYCVGSRQPEGENKYCSRYCCTSTIFTALTVSEKFPETEQFHLTRGLRTYGKYENLFNQANKSGHIFLQTYEDDLPTVFLKDAKTTISINDILTGRMNFEIQPDLLVLVTGMEPRANNNIGEILKIPKGRDHFFNEIHMKLRPVETVIDGVTLAGACQGPKNIIESMNSALSAAAKSYSYISSGKLQLSPIVAEVNENLCQWCDACSKACPFDAVSSIEKDGKMIAVINNTVCKGCGMCLPVCPVNALQLISYSDGEIESMIDFLAND